MSVQLTISDMLSLLETAATGDEQKDVNAKRAAELVFRPAVLSLANRMAREVATLTDTRQGTASSDPFDHRIMVPFRPTDRDQPWPEMFTEYDEGGKGDWLDDVIALDSYDPANEAG